MAQILKALLYKVQSGETFLYEILMPDVVLCVTLFGVEMAVILIELPFICAYFWKSPVVRDVYVRKSVMCTSWFCVEMTYRAK